MAAGSGRDNSRAADGRGGLRAADRTRRPPAPPSGSEGPARSTQPSAPRWTGAQQPRPVRPVRTGPGSGTGHPPRVLGAQPRPYTLPGPPARGTLSHPHRGSGTSSPAAVAGCSPSSDTRERRPCPRAQAPSTPAAGGTPPSRSRARAPSGLCQGHCRLLNSPVIPTAQSLTQGPEPACH